MDDRVTRTLKTIAIAMAVLFIGWATYDRFVADVAPGDMAYHAGNRAFEDAEYARAAADYRQALAEAPDHIWALRGLARTLHLQGQYEESLALYDQAIERDPDFAGTYANRGILLDSMGRHEDALDDYDRALALDAEVAEGPHWLTRFLRNQPEAPPTIVDRARYLRAELAKPEAERVLRVPDIDGQQRSYKQ